MAGAPNVPAFVLGGIYSGIFAKCAPKGADWLPGTVPMHLGGVALSCSAVAGVAAMMDPAAAINTLGWAGTGLVVVMFSGCVPHLCPLPPSAVVTVHLVTQREFWFVTSRRC